MTKEIKIDAEERIDESGVDSFRAMGYTSLSENMIKVYKHYKRKKDALQPANRLSPEAMAAVATIGDMVDHQIEFSSKEEPSNKE